MAQGRVGKDPATPICSLGWHAAHTASPQSHSRTKDRAVEAVAISFAVMRSAAEAAGQLGGAIKISRRRF